MAQGSWGKRREVGAYGGPTGENRILSEFQDYMLQMQNQMSFEFSSIPFRPLDLHILEIDPRRNIYIFFRQHFPTGAPSCGCPREKFLNSMKKANVVRWNQGETWANRICILKLTDPYTSFRKKGQEQTKIGGPFTRHRVHR